MPLRVVAIAGSLRKGSYNRGLVRAAVELASENLEVVPLEIRDLPMYDFDLEEGGFPEAVQRFHQAIREADGLLLATPEYNRNTSGALKNAIDWASRPPRENVIGGKPTAIMGASAGMGGTISAQAALRKSFVLLNVPCMMQPEMYATFARQKFSESGDLTDEGTREFLGKFLSAFEAWIKKQQA